jgi:hypothetical protein
MTDFLTRIARHTLGLAPTARLLDAVRYAPEDVPSAFEKEPAAAPAPAMPAPRRSRAVDTAPPQLEAASAPPRDAMPGRTTDVIASDREGPAPAVPGTLPEEPRTVLPHPPVPATLLPRTIARERIPPPATSPEHVAFETHAMATHDVAEPQREPTPGPLPAQYRRQPDDPRHPDEREGPPPSSAAGAKASRAFASAERVAARDAATTAGEDAGGPSLVLEASRHETRMSRIERMDAHDSEPPAVHVTIGRVEVRTVPPASPPPPAPSAPTPRLSLDEYLRQHNGRRR